MYLLFDIGGTKTRVAVSPDAKRLGKVRIVPTPKNYKSGIELLQKISQELSGGHKIRAVAGGLAGSFDRTKSRIIGGGVNIKGWRKKSLKKELEKVFDVPVYLENDAALAGLAEAARGAGKGKEIVTYFTVSTGFGGARIVKGKIDVNARGFEPSYEIVSKNADRIYEFIAGRWIESRYHKKPEEITSLKIRKELAWWLAIALNNAIVFWSPDIMIVGGSVMNIIPISQVRAYLKKIYIAGVGYPPVVRAKLGDLAGIYGALELLKQKRL